MTWQWPWVSRRAYDDVVHERDRLLTQITRDAVCIRDLMDNVIRMKRAEVGLRETPRVVKPEMQKPVTVPPEVRALYVGRCQSQVFEAEIERQAVEAFKGGAPWSEVARVLVLQLGEVPQEMAVEA